MPAKIGRPPFVRKATRFLCPSRAKLGAQAIVTEVRTLLPQVLRTWLAHQVKLGTLHGSLLIIRECPEFR